MRRALKLHPESPGAAAAGIEVEITRSRAGNLNLLYLVSGGIGGLRLPAVTVPARADALWQHTCFEAFLRSSRGDAYYELNFAPSTQWAAYRFSGYRRDMSVAKEIAPPHIEVQSSGRRYELRVSVALEGALDLPHDATWRVGLSAVIEETGGSKSYWALAHPQGKPDFHHADCFVLELSAASSP